MKRKQSLLISLTLLCFSAAFRADAATYTVKAGGGGNYTTIQACANVAVAGDTCFVYAGTYSEYVSVPTSGSAGNPITFQVNPGDSVKMQGFNIAGISYIKVGGSASNTGFEITGLANGSLISLSSASYITIQNNNIHNGGTNDCIRNSLSLTSVSSYVTIRNNTLTLCGQPSLPTIGIFAYGDHWLVDGNNISKVIDYIGPYCTNMVIRNNTFGPESCSDFPGSTCPTGPPEYHIDGFDHSCSGDPPWSFNLVENNTMSNAIFPDSHFGIWHSNNLCTEKNSIVRGNSVISVGGFILADRGAFPNIKVYNNSISTALFKEYLDLVFSNGSTGAASINNIYYDAVVDGGYVIGLDGTTSASFVAKNDLAYNPSCGTACSWTAPISTEPGVVLNRDPKFVNPTSNLHLRAGSPAIGAGTYLTTVANTDTGSGISLIVNDAGFFQDGSGIVNADWIRVRATTAQIASINYDSNTITLANPISRSPGDPVYLYKDSNGTVVLLASKPDIGAYQFTRTAPIAPTVLTTVTR